MSWPFDAADGSDSWGAAERVAAEQRTRRLQPPAQQPARARLLRAVIVQQRGASTGSLAFIALYVPLYLSMATSSHDRLGLFFLGLGAAVLVIGAAFIGVAYRRCTRFIRRAENVTEPA